MLNPENRPTTRVLPDGRVMPTSKGLKLTEVEKQKMRDAIRGKKRNPEYVISVSTSWNILRPLVLRGGIPIEIAELTDLPLGRVQRVIRYKREFRAVEDYNLAENRRERKIRGGFRASRTRRGITPGEHEIKSIAFAKELVREKHITEDTTSSSQLKELYAWARRQLPYNFSDRLRLEVFLSTRKALLKDGNQDPLIRYLETGAKIDGEWFRESLAAEEDFISEHFVTEPVYDGEDEQGFYRLVDGRKWRQYMETDDSGQTLFDNHSLSLKRKRMREKV